MSAVRFSRFFFLSFIIFRLRGPIWGRIYAYDIIIARALALVVLAPQISLLAGRCKVIFRACVKSTADR